jgi:centromere protein C
LQPLQPDEEEEDSDHGKEDDEVSGFVEESMAMLNGGDDDELPDPEAEPTQSEGEEEEVEDDDPPAPAARKKRGRPAKGMEAAAAKSPKPQKKPVKPVVEEPEDGHHEEDEHTEAEEEEPVARPQKPAPGRRGRPPKAGTAAAAAAQAPPRASKKRRSLDEEEAAAAQEPSPEPQPKRQRTSPAAASKKPAPKKPAASSSSKKTVEPPAAAPKKPTGRGRKRKSSIDPGDVSQVAIARRPPLPKSRGLLINRREVPGDPGSSMLRTRSGRTSFKPLAYWRNERVEFDKDEAEDAFAGRRNKSKFVLPSVKEIVRVDEPEPEVRPKSRRGGGAGVGKRGGAGRRGRRRRSSGFDEDDEDDGPAEVWELDPGTVTGEVVVWQPEYEFSPPAPNDLVSVMDKQLAISGAAIKTTEVVGGEFRYAKVFSEGFIGAGVVDLPPGAIKRLKNSRKVFMIFFVHAGRVLVTVQETSFRISKGGIFIVPRCKFIAVVLLETNTGFADDMFLRQRVHNRE